MKNKKSQPSAIKPLPEKNIDKRIIYALSFAIPFLSMLIIYAIFGVFPFGGKTALVMDLNGQYADFFAFYHRVLTGGDSLMYSFTKEMGGNVFGLFAYYLSSPFFLLALFFPMSAMPEAIALITMLKIGCCGLAFALFINYVFKKSDISVLIFSTAYALMTYSMHYAMCVMWLDGAIWLPIILIGAERIISGKSGWCFLLAYAASLFSNYYTAYMNTLFTVIYFFYRYFSGDNKKSAKDLLIKTAKIAGLGITGVLLCTVVLYPTFLDIFNGKMASGSYVPDGFWNAEITNIARRLFPAQYDSITNNGNPNIFCGMLCGAAIGVFFLNPKIKLKTKIASLIVFAVFFTSFFIKRVDIAWHIFQYPNWYPYRYAYTFCFFSTMTAFIGFSSIDGEKRGGVIAGLCVYAALLAAVWIFDSGVLTNRALAVTGCVLAAVYIAGMIIMQYGGDIRPYICAALLIITCGELILNGSRTISGLNGEFEYIPKDEYARTVRDIYGMTDFLKEHDNGFYRAEKTFSRTDNDAMSFGYNGMTHYSSTYNNNIVHFNNIMGMFQGYVVTSYMGSTLLTDSLLGVKYVTSEKPVNDEYTGIYAYDQYNVYENPYALPIGCAADRSAVNDVRYGSSAIENQRIFAQALLGGSYMSEVEANRLSDRETEFTADTDGTYYMDLKGAWTGDIKLTVNGVPAEYRLDENEKKMFCLGNYGGGDIIHVTLSSPMPSDEMHIGVLDTAGFERACLEKQSAHSLNVTDYGHTWIEGTINLGEGELLFTSIPYEKGWTAYVDGKKTEPVPVLDGTFLAVEAGEGEHEIRLKYHVPGFIPSLSISLLTLAGILLAVYAGKSKKTRQKLALIKKKLYNTNNDQSKGDD